ncbi:hypothetical protein [Legionella cardiaca]|uniref:Uncharacterized protein n=1 Tax=Legionella cardiaca TaxID=1071983 RepID=A0ABY8ANT1_9GAMM|nr:hypothetical protein [Legionella cardiaca]WED42119.1 hypothetical protein PXX05_09275 [Legionella cardiaca]
MYRLFTSSFNRNSIVKGSLQVVNLIAFGAATYNLLTNPDAGIAEFGLDLFVHGASYFALSDSVSLLGKTSNGFINAVRLGAIYTGLTSVGCSEVPLAAAAADSVVHFANMVAPILNARPKETMEHIALQH